MPRTLWRRPRKWYEDRTSQDGRSRQGRTRDMSSRDETIQVGDIARSGLGSSPVRVEGRCPSCGCNTRQDAIKAAFWTSTGLFVVDDIPAWLCERCGEPSFETETAQRIQELVTHPTGHIQRKIPVSVYTVSRVSQTQTPCRLQSSDSPYLRPAAFAEDVGPTVEPTRMPSPCEPLPCKYCGSETVDGLTQSAFWVEGELIAVENITARVCSRCGEQFYDEDTAEKIAALEKGGCIDGLTRREILVPILSVVHAVTSEPSVFTAAGPGRL